MNDLLLPAGYPQCILITASQVSLLLRSHKIIGPPELNAGDGIDVMGTAAAPLDHVAVAGPGLIESTTDGISITNANYVQVSGVTAALNYNAGLGRHSGCGQSDHYHSAGAESSLASIRCYRIEHRHFFSPLPGEIARRFKCSGAGWNGSRELRGRQGIVL